MFYVDVDIYSIPFFSCQINSLSRLKYFCVYCRFPFKKPIQRFRRCNLYKNPRSTLGVFVRMRGRGWFDRLTVPFPVINKHTVLFKESQACLRMRGRGFEPPRPCGHQPLKLARLPVPTPALIRLEYVLSFRLEQWCLELWILVPASCPPPRFSSFFCVLRGPLSRGCSRVSRVAPLSAVGYLF
jgi:hypothetical protein